MNMERSKELDQNKYDPSKGQDRAREQFHGMTLEDGEDQRRNRGNNRGRGGY